MRKHRIKKLIGVLLATLFLAFNYSSYVQNFTKYPSEIQIFEGDKQLIDFKLPLKVEVRNNEEDINVLKFNGDSLGDKLSYNLNGPLYIEPTSQGDTSLYFKLFGLIPIKKINVNVTPEIALIPGGNSIGVALYTNGALIVGISEVVDTDGISHYPALDAGLSPGDVIEKINGVAVKDAGHLSELINKVKGKSLDMECRRDNKVFTAKIKPIQDSNDSKYRLGIWVRDSTAGVGTLSFIDPETKNFGALGHAITDVDTGSLLSVKDGKISESQIIDVKIGKKGLPGELVGNFSDKKSNIGNILKNTIYGIYGKATKDMENPIYTEPIPIAYQYNIKTGPATILTTVDDEGIKEFDIEILKVNSQSSPSSKGLVIEITDEELLAKTGGIVQGMSGSPIIQDGRIVGVVTHVFVNDPKKGYGIFIEWMLDETNKIID